jgi:hypothetical protein
MFFFATVFLMMLTGLGPTPALIITGLLVVAGGILRLKLGLFSDNQITHESHTQQTEIQPRQEKPHMNFRDVQALKRISRGQYGVFDMNRQNKLMRNVWRSQKKK